MESLRENEFAMWFPCDDDQVFSKSEITLRWTKIYEICSGIESYIAANLLRFFGLIEDSINRISLPEDSDSIAFQTREEDQFIISFSQEKGIRFHFSANTPLKTRLQLLDQYIDLCKDLKKQTEDHNLQTDEGSDSSGWWNATLLIATKNEEYGPIDGVGKIF